MSRTEALQAELAGSLRLLDHPLIQHKLSLLRDRDTPPGQFRQFSDAAGLRAGNARCSAGKGFERDIGQALPT